MTFALLLIGSCSTPSGDGEDLDQFRSDVLECEEAFARLEKCCPQKPDPLGCQYARRRGCNGELTTSYPYEGRKIIEHSCEDIVRDNYCTEATRPR